MATSRNLSRIRESCERMATGDPDSGEAPLITMEDCYTIDGSRYIKNDKYEREKFGETRMEKINNYTLEYRKRQKNLLIRRDLINTKFTEIINDIQSGIVNDDTPKVETRVTSKVETRVTEDTSKVEKRENKTQRAMNVKNAKQIRGLQSEIEDLRRKLDKNNSDYKKQLGEYSKLGKNEEKIRKRLGLETWDEFIEKVEDNKFEYKLDELLELLNSNDNIDDEANLGMELPDKTANDDEATEARRAAAEAAADNKAEETTIKKEGFENPSRKLEELNETIGRKLAVYENLGKIRIENSPILGARANKTILNSIELVSDFETFATEIVSSIRDRYYNDESTDYKRLVEQTQNIDENYIKRGIIGDASHFTNKSYRNELDRRGKLEAKTRMLAIVLAVVFVITITLVGLLIKA